MKNVVGWFEVPVSDMGRAKKFYQNIFDVELQDMEFPNGLKMSMFPMEDGGVSGALCMHQEFYKPSQDGTLIYFTAGPDLQVVLDRVERNGGKVLRPKTQINEEYGYMAIFQDTEGNRLALHSME